jgi:predicted small secreted protein
VISSRVTVNGKWNTIYDLKGKSMQKVILFILLTTILLLAACNTGQPQIGLDVTNLDLGDVVNGEIMTRDLVVRNNGAVELVIEAVSTSCGCTKATVSPLTIPAGSSGTLSITFDSGAHGPELEGQLIRQVFINSNDPQQPEVALELVANILSPDGS